TGTASPSASRSASGPSTRANGVRRPAASQAAGASAFISRILWRRSGPGEAIVDEMDVVLERVEQARLRGRHTRGADLLLQMSEVARDRLILRPGTLGAGFDLQELPIEPVEAPVPPLHDQQGDRVGERNQDSDERDDDEQGAGREDPEPEGEVALEERPARLVERPRLVRERQVDRLGGREPAPPLEHSGARGKPLSAPAGRGL